MSEHPYTPPVMPTAEELAESMRTATLKQVKATIEFAKKADRNQRGSKHRPGATKTAVKKRAAQSRKRSRNASKSRRKNR